MTRPFPFALFASLAWLSATFAQAPAKGVEATLGVQRALAAAREHLRQQRPAEAVSVLEAELVNADGNPQYLATLKDAYAAHLRNLQLQRADAAVIDSVRRRLQAVGGSTSDASPAGPRSEGQGGAAADIRPPAPPPPPIPDPPESVPLAAVKAPVAEDPFQQPVRKDAGAGNELARASAAFAAKHYPQAAGLFAEADRKKQPFTPAQRDEWAYCRLHAVAVRLNRGAEANAALPELGREAEEAMRLASDRLKPFGTQVLDEIRRRGPAGPVSVPAGWQVVEAGSFRVLHRGAPAVAAEVSRTAEAARGAMYERWAGPAGGPWAPRCDIFLHPTGAEYARATGKPADQAGHSTVGVKGERVVSRRIDLRADDPALLDGTLPSEVTQVLLAELYAEQPLPRWAVVGMSALAESPEGVARYQRAVPGLLKEKQLFAVGPFLDRAGFPAPDAVTAFYAESVSLVAYMVSLRGPKAFAAFLREAPRRGYAKALATHYGIKDPAELQERWVRHVMGGE